MEKAKRILFVNIFVILVAIVYVFVLIIGNVVIDKISLATIAGSYADKYAQEHHITQVNLADNQQQYFDERYELFDYNVKDEVIELDSYSGASSDLVIPTMIDGRVVSTLTENFMDSIKNVDRLYIPSSITTVGGSPRGDLTICCVDDTSFYLDNKESDWNFELLHDSDFVNFYLGNLDFNYNLIGDSVEIVSYVGENQELLVIPSYINGHPVTSVSMDLYGIAPLVVIPETVESITGNNGVLLYRPIFVIETLFSILAFVVTLLSVNLVLPRYKGLDDYMLRGNQVVIIILYVILQVGFSIYAIYCASISAYLGLIVSSVILLGYLLAIFLPGRGRVQVLDVEEKLISKTERMKSIKIAAKGLADGIENKDLRKEVQRLEDEIRFSDPVSDSTLDVVEMKIERSLYVLKETIAEGDVERIKAETETLLYMVKKRNIQTKSRK